MYPAFSLSQPTHNHCHAQAGSLASKKKSTRTQQRCVHEVDMRLSGVLSSLLHRQSLYLTLFGPASCRLMPAMRPLMVRLLRCRLGFVCLFSGKQSRAIQYNSASSNCAESAASLLPSSSASPWFALSRAKVFSTTTTGHFFTT